MSSRTQEGALTNLPEYFSTAKRPRRTNLARSELENPEAVCPEGSKSNRHSTAGVTVELKQSFKSASIRLILSFFFLLPLSLSPFPSLSEKI